MANRSQAVTQFGSVTQPIVNTKTGVPTATFTQFMSQAFSGLGTILQASPLDPPDNTFWVESSGGYVSLKARAKGITVTIASVLIP